MRDFLALPRAKGISAGTLIQQRLQDLPVSRPQGMFRSTVRFPAGVLLIYGALTLIFILEPALVFAPVFVFALPFTFTLAFPLLAE